MRPSGKDSNGESSRDCLREHCEDSGKDSNRYSNKGLFQGAM